MQMVDMGIRKQRAHRLRQLGSELLNNFMQMQLGKQTKVLIEKDNQGFNEYYIPTKVNGKTKIGQIVDVVNEGIDENGFMAKI